MLTTFLLLFALPATPTQVHLAQQPAPLTFHLRHLHAVTNTSRIVFADVPPTALDAHTLQTQLQRTHRPSSFAAHARARLRRGDGELWWDEEEIVGPDVTSRDTLLQLAKMTNNAYVYPDEGEWYDLDGAWNISYPFGWEDDADGFRGHVFATSDNSTVVVAIKGTSAGPFGGKGPTGKKDKLNNNLLFSCCCAKVGFTWTPVCGCHAGGWKCDRDCLEDSLVEDSLYYPTGTNLYNNVTYMYPNANIWLVGHSLGGALASLLGVTFGAPVVAFEAPGEKMAAERLHLPSPPSTHHVTHVYHTADPIPMGTCNGVLSLCATVGYAMESRCHMGKSSVYDTVTKKGWSVSIRSHGIVVVIDDLLSKDWGEKEGKHEVPVAEVEEDCVECYSWEYGDFLDSFLGRNAFLPDTIMSMLSAARYGKDLVRVFRVVRNETGVHDIAEYNVRALVEGSIDASYTKADNSVVVATDSIKNIIYYLAKISPHVLSPELFALHIGAFLLEKYAHLERAYVDVERLKWSRIVTGGTAHPFSFQRDGEEKRVARVEVEKKGKGQEARVTAGLVDLLVLKSSGSSFENFVRDEFTTLAEVDDRIFSTAVDMTYTFPAVGLAGVEGIGQLEGEFGYEEAARKARGITLDVFASDDSASVQATLYKMGERLIGEHRQVNTVSYVLPNKHYLPVDMRYLGIENVKPSAAEVFVPVGAPSGSITASVSRDVRAAVDSGVLG